MSKVVSRGDPIEPVYLNNVKQGASGWVVTSGLIVSQRGAGANMSVDVASGVAWINGAQVTKGSTTNIAITAAHASYDRYDLIVINSSGTISVIDGTAAATSYANDYDFETNNAILLAEVYVPATDTTIEDAQITSKIVMAELNTIIPSGLISMWHGLIANIPTGWALCDGTSGTPDLRERFVRGAPAATEAGGTGGADTHTLAESEIPTHSHNVSGSGSNSTPVGGNYLHADTGPQDEATSTYGGGGAHNNMPAYYQILFIMKT